MIDIQGLEKKFNDRAIFWFESQAGEGQGLCLNRKEWKRKDDAAEYLGKARKDRWWKGSLSGKDLKPFPLVSIFETRWAISFKISAS